MWQIPQFLDKKRKRKVFHRFDLSTSSLEFFKLNGGKLVENSNQVLIFQAFCRKVFLKFNILKCGKLFLKKESQKKKIGFWITKFDDFR